MDLASLVNTWGYYFSYPLKDKDVIHSEDLEKLESPRNGLVALGLCQCIALEGNYLVLTGRFGICRAKPDGYTKLKPPIFEVGEYVYLRKKLDRPRQITARGYHRQRKEIIYIVETKWTPIDLYWFDHQLIAAKEVDAD